MRFPRPTCTAPPHTLTPPLTFPRSSPLRRLDARDRRVEGLVMDLMVCAAPESPTRPSLEEPRVSFVFAASSSFSRPDARFGGATEPRRTPSRADDRRSLSHHEHEQGEIACTGRVRFPWCETRVAVAALARGAMARAARRAASKAFAANHPGDARECDSADPSSSSPAAELGEAVARAEAHADALETRLASFPEPPFTAQRLVELLLDPEASGYSTPEKLRVAAEKTLAVTGMTAIDANAAASEGLAGSLEAAPHARRALDPVSLEQSAFVRALVREAEAEARGDESDGAPAGSSPAADGGSPSASEVLAEKAAAFPGEALPGKAGGLAAELAGGFAGVERVGEKRAREGERPNEPNEPSFADEMENRLPGKPDVGAELVTAGA